MDLDSVHHTRPAHTEVPADSGHRVAVLADPTAHLGTGPLGQRRPRRGRIVEFGPRARRALRLAATLACSRSAPSGDRRPLDHEPVPGADRAARLARPRHLNGGCSRTDHHAPARRAPNQTSTTTPSGARSEEHTQAFDPADQIPAGVGAAGPAALVRMLRLQRPKERLGCWVVPAHAGPTHRLDHASMVAELIDSADVYCFGRVQALFLAAIRDGAVSRCPRVRPTAGSDW